ncbi:MAG: hypothetical protein RIC35_04630 [Marinoscillum sp.]
MSSSFKSINYLQLVFDLAIVFIGVYTAFYFSESKAKNAKIAEGEKVIGLLEMGIDRYEKAFASFANYHEKHNASFKERLDNDLIPDYSSTFYPAPQYPVEVITHILTRESYEVFSIDFYVPLTAFANALERMMYVEEKLVLLAERYQKVPAKTHPDYNIIAYEQIENAERYYEYMELRKKVALELVERAKGLKLQLNELKAKKGIDK